MPSKSNFHFASFGFSVTKQAVSVICIALTEEGLYNRLDIQEFLHVRVLKYPAMKIARSIDALIHSC